MVTSFSSDESLSFALCLLSVFGVLQVLILIFGDDVDVFEDDDDSTLIMLVSLLVLDKVLELDLKLPSQLSLEMETDLCLGCFLETRGLGG